MALREPSQFFLIAALSLLIILINMPLKAFGDCNAHYPSESIHSLLKSAAETGAQGSVIWEDYERGKAFYDEARRIREQASRLMEEGVAKRRECKERFRASSKVEATVDEAKITNERYNSHGLSQKLTDQALSTLLNVHKNSLSQLDTAFAQFDEYQKISQQQHDFQQLLPPKYGNGQSLLKNSQPTNANIENDLNALLSQADQQGRSQPPPIGPRRSRSRRSSSASSSTFGLGFNQALSGLRYGQFETSVPTSTFYNCSNYDPNYPPCPKEKHSPVSGTAHKARSSQ